MAPNRAGKAVAQFSRRRGEDYAQTLERLHVFISTMAGLVSRIEPPKERSEALCSAGRHGCLARAERGADRATLFATLITAAKPNDVDPKAWLADVLANIADMPISRLG